MLKGKTWLIPDNTERPDDSDTFARKKAIERLRLTVGLEINKQ